MGKVNLPTRESLREQVAYRKYTLSAKVQEGLLGLLGYEDIGPHLKKVITAIESVLGEHAVATIALDNKPRPGHIRRRCEKIQKLSTLLLKEISIADQYSLSALLNAGYKPPGKSSGGFIVDNFKTISQQLNDLRASLESLSTASKEAAGSNGQSSRHRQTRKSYMVTVELLGRIYENHHRNTEEKVGDVKRLKEQFISRAAIVANISLPSNWARMLRSKRKGSTI